MNFLAHGFRHLDRPWFLAGTALPDWLRACGRRLPRREPALGDPRPECAEAELARGARRHLRDDARFHSSDTFREVTGAMTRAIRERYPEDRCLRARFFSHVLAEMLLDASLAEARPPLLDRYYAALCRVEPRRVETIVDGWLPDPVDGLAHTIERYVRLEFLRDYARDDGLLWRFSRVVRSVGLPELPPGFEELLPGFRRLVDERAGELVAVTER